MRLHPADPGAAQLRKAVRGPLEGLADRIAGDPSPPSLDELGLDDLIASAPVLGALDRMGRHREVERVLRGYGRHQGWGGGFEADSSGPGATGAAVWSLVDHGRITEDLDYLDGVYRRIRRALRWLERTRTPDGTDPHTGLMPADGTDGEPEDHGVPMKRYRATFWAMAGAQEAARAGAVLHRRRIQRDGEILFHELRRALRRSLEGLAATDRELPLLAPTGKGDGEGLLTDILLSVVCGETFPPDYEPLVRTLEGVVGSGDHPLSRSAMAAHQLLRRGDPRVWDLVDTLDPGDGGLTVVEAGLLFWLLRSLHVSDQRAILLLAPGHALRPLPDGNEVVVEAAPSIHGRVSYRLWRDGERLHMEWSGLERHAPENFIWPLPGRVYRVEPPNISLTDSRMAIRLDPAGGRLDVELVPDSSPG
ncbi:MAG: hypothetical protein R6W82_06405 [bacterium]